MKEKVDRHTLAVLVCRFQVSRLSEAHTELIKEALANHPKVLILLGLSATRGTINNPLDFQPRKQMILEGFPHDKYPQITIGYIKDVPSNEEWSKKLDELISDHLSPSDSAILYGGRDSFIPFYTTKRFPVRELTSARYISGTELRKQISEAPQSTPDFRAGAIWAAYQRYPSVFPTADILPFDKEGKRVLLARKSGEKLYRLIGGFASPGDESFEQTALRELKEESELDVLPENLFYVGSKKIDDWRYRNEKDKIITHLYLAEPYHTEASASDDIAEVRWFEWNHFTPAILVDEHKLLQPLYAAFVKTKYKIAEPKGGLNIL